MDSLIFGLPAGFFFAAVAVAFGAGFVKGAVGFAMPMLMISGFSIFLPAPVALAALILATLRTYWRLIGMVMLFIFFSAPLVTVLPQRVLYLMLGGPILLFAVSQLLGRQLILHAAHRNRAELAMGAVGGFFGGISGIWGPPVIAYLLSFNTPKTEMVRVQGVVYLMGSVMLVASHLTSGVLNARTLPLSAALVVPAAAGMWLGFRVQDKLDPAIFRKATLAVLAVAALNLIRKGLMG